MIELLRSAATAQFPIVLGSPDQKPIKGHVKFSALLACIEGEDFLEQQDLDRIVFIKFGKKKGKFERMRLPMFTNFVKDDMHKGFAIHCLKGWYLYRDIYAKLLVQLTEEYPEIGHKARGLASIITGYSILCRSANVILPFLKALKTSDILTPYKVKVALAESTEDIIERILRTVVTEHFSAIGTSSLKTIYEMLSNYKYSTEIKPLGLKLSGPILNIYTCEFKNFNEKFLGLKPRYLNELLARSIYFKKISNSYFNGKKTRYFQFDLTKYLQEQKDAEEKTKALSEPSSESTS